MGGKQMFHNWLIGNMGVRGEYMYQSIHIVSTMVVLAVVIITTLLGASKKIGTKAKRSILKGICWFQLAFEIGWRLIYLFVKKDSVLCWWPLYPCNVGGVLIPLFALLDCKTGKKMFYLFGFVGGCLTFALPEGIFVSDVLVFPILKSILQHTGLLMIPLFEYVSKTYRPTLKDMGWVVAGLVIHVINSEGITRLLGFTGDYMFFRSGMPFVIPGVPQYITLSVFAVAVLALLSILSDPKSVFKSRKKNTVA